MKLVRLLFSPAMLIVARVTLGAVLLYAGIVKLPAAWQFAEAIANYRLLPAQFNQLLAVVLPWCEILVGLLLVFGLWLRASATVSLILFIAFGIAVISALARGLDIDCGCFGTDTASRVGFETLAIETAGILVSLYILYAVGRLHQPQTRQA